jgi:hypothetical protein
MANIPDDVLLKFFRAGTSVLLELDCAREYNDFGMQFSLSDGRRLLLDKQRSCLNRVIYEYNEDKLLQVKMERVQLRLQTLKSDETTPYEITEAMETMDEAARLALCRLVLYAECKEEQNDTASTTSRQLQTLGRMERSKLLEFIALNRTSMKVSEVKTYLKDGTPLFDTIPYQEMETSQKFPQKRLERIQCMISRAVGFDPDFTTSELKRIFFNSSTSSSNEHSNDHQLVGLFEQLISQMQLALTNASLQSSENSFSDMDQGGVTRVVSVNYSEVIVGDNNNGKGGTTNARGIAPTQESMATEVVTEEDQKRQLRLASDATVLQQEILGELLNLTEHERDLKLEEAQQASNDFLEQAMRFPAGPERIDYLRNIDPHTQRLLAMQNIWAQALKAHGGKPPKKMTHQQ